MTGCSTGPHFRTTIRRTVENHARGPTFIETRNERKTKTMAAKKPRMIGFNHIALEVGDIDEALDFYGELFDFKLRSKSETMAFIDLGDQFINFSKGREQAPDDRRHVGLVVDDKEAVRQRLSELDIKVLPGRFLDFLDPWGNRIEIVGYQNIQFSKAPYVLRGMGIEDLPKNQSALEELAEKGMAPD